MTMNIYAEKGDKVKVTEESIRNGYDHVRELAEKYLQVGQTYTINYTVVGGFQNEVYLQEIPDVAFNAVQFEDA